MSTKKWLFSKIFFVFIARSFYKILFFSSFFVVFFFAFLDIVYLTLKSKGLCMDVKYKKNGKTLTVYVYGELDECSSSHAKLILDNLISDNLNAQKVVFDLSGISFMDSTGIGILIGRYKKLKTFDIPSYITGASLAAEKVIEVSGLYKIMPRF